MKVYDNIIEAVGKTPLVRLNKVVPPGAAQVLAKCEYGIEFTAAVQKEHIFGVQFHPEFKSRPLTPHPLFCSFIKAAKLK